MNSCTYIYLIGFNQMQLLSLLVLKLFYTWPLQVVSSVLLARPKYSLIVSSFSGMTRCSVLIWYIYFLQTQNQSFPFIVSQFPLFPLFFYWVGYNFKAFLVWRASKCLYIKKKYIMNLQEYLKLNSKLHCFCVSLFSIPRLSPYFHFKTSGSQRQRR